MGLRVVGESKGGGRPPTSPVTLGPKEAALRLETAMVQTLPRSQARPAQVETCSQQQDGHWGNEAKVEGVVTETP